MELNFETEIRQKRMNPLQELHRSHYILYKYKWSGNILQHTIENCDNRTQKEVFLNDISRTLSSGADACFNDLKNNAYQSRDN